MNGWSKEPRTVPLEELIGRALVAKVLAGQGSRYKAGKRKRISKREKTRQFWAANPDVKPWPLRPRLANKTTIERRKKK